MFDDACGLTKAVLTGNKTRTARFEKMPDRYRHYLNMKEQNAIPYLINTYNDKTGEFTICQAHPFREGMEEFASFKPRYKRGDTYAVAQPYCRLPKELQQQFGLDNSLPGWTNKMFVKAELMPHRIRIKSLRLEHLQDITDDDARRECTLFYNFVDKKYEACGIPRQQFDTPRDAFAALIDKVGGKGTWEKNPWVVRYEFELINKEG